MCFSFRRAMRATGPRRAQKYPEISRELRPARHGSLPHVNHGALRPIRQHMGGIAAAQVRLDEVERRLDVGVAGPQFQFQIAGLADLAVEQRVFGGVEQGRIPGERFAGPRGAPATQVGPLARADLRDALHRQVSESVALGAQVAVGGALPPGPGYFYPPTVLTRVTPEMPVFREETFGPVAAVVRVVDADDAVRRANKSPFGLGSALWTADLDRARRLAREIEAGSVFINGMVASDPRLPFGGVKHSGYGRELSIFGMREFVNIQTVWIGPASRADPLAARSE